MTLSRPFSYVLMRPITSQMLSYCFVKNIATAKIAAVAAARTTAETNSEPPHEYAWPGSSFECSRTKSGTGQDHKLPKRTLV